MKNFLLILTIIFLFSCSSNNSNKYFSDKYTLKGTMSLGGTDKAQFAFTWIFKDDGTVKFTPTIYADLLKGTVSEDKEYEGTYEIFGEEVVVTIPSHKLSPFKFDYNNGNVTNPRDNKGRKLTEL